MGRLSGFKYREIVNLLKKFGFEFYRQAADDGDYISYNLAFYRRPPFSVRVYPEDDD